MTSSNNQNTNAMTLPRLSRNEKEIDLMEVLDNLIAHKWTILIIAAVIFLLSTIYTFTATPIYRAISLIEVEEKKEGIPGMSGITDIFTEGPTSHKEIALIKSYNILGQAVDRLHLNLRITPRFFPLIGPSMYRRYTGDGLAEPLFGLENYAWGGESLAIKFFNISGPLSEKSSEWEIIVGNDKSYSLLDQHGKQIVEGKYNNSESVNYHDSTLTILIDHIDGRSGQKFSISYTPRNKTIEDLKGTLRVSEEEKDTGILTFTLDGKDKEHIKDILNTVSSLYVKSNKDKQIKDAQQVLDFIDEQLPELKKKLDDAQRQLQSFRQQVGSVDLESETKNSLTAIMEYEKMIVQMEVEREELRRQFTENNPNVKVMDNQIDKIKGKIAKLEEKMHILPQHEWEFIQKTLDVEVASALYVALLNKGQEIKVAKASTIPNVRIIDSAELLSDPVKPKKLLLLTVGTISGLIFGIGWVLLRIFLHKGVEDPEVIERETSIPVFANIPHSETETDIFSKIHSRDKEGTETKLLAFENDADLAMEAMRSFRTNMRFTLKGSESNVIIISGPSPSIGKSFFSSNYSAIAAKDGQRVLLVDADMRKGHLHKQMGVPISPGLSELIAGDITIERSTHRINNNLYFISCGQRPPNSAELVSSDSFHSLMEQFKEHFDLVIIDTPPILAVADASIIAQYGGLLFLLLRSGQHPIGEIIAATSKFQRSGVKVTGILINDVHKKASSYGYTYEYS